MDIDNDYKAMIRQIQSKEIQRLEREDEKEQPMKPRHSPSLTFAFASSSMPFHTLGIGRMRSKSATTHMMSANILYQVSKQNQISEKNWMRQLKRKRYKVYAAKQRLRDLQSDKKEIQQRLQEMNQQIVVRQRMERLDKIQSRIETLKQSKFVLCKNASNELHQLKLIVETLIKSI